MTKPENATQFVVKVRVQVELDVEVQIVAAQTFDQANEAASDILKGAVQSMGDAMKAASPSVQMVEAPKLKPMAIMAGWSWKTP